MATPDNRLPAHCITRNNRRHILSGGFTLVELLTVISIMLILASLLLGVGKYSRQSALKARTRGQFQQIAMALDLYKSDYGVYPITPTNAPMANVITHVLNGGTSNNNLALYTLITGYSVTSGPPSASPRRNYYPELKPAQLKSKNGTNYVVDAYNNVWGYFNTTNDAWKANQYNGRGYDLWSFGSNPFDPTNSLICNWRQQ